MPTDNSGVVDPRVDRRFVLRTIKRDDHFGARPKPDAFPSHRQNPLARTQPLSTSEEAGLLPFDLSAGQIDFATAPEGWKSRLGSPVTIRAIMERDPDSIISAYVVNATWRGVSVLQTQGDVSTPWVLNELGPNRQGSYSLMRFSIRALSLDADERIGVLSIAQEASANSVQALVDDLLTGRRAHRLALTVAGRAGVKSSVVKEAARHIRDSLVGLIGYAWALVKAYVNYAVIIPLRVGLYLLYRLIGLTGVQAWAKCTAFRFVQNVAALYATIGGWPGHWAWYALLFVEAGAECAATLLRRAFDGANSAVTLLGG